MTKTVKLMIAALVIFVLVASTILVSYIRRTDIHGAIRAGDTARVEAMLAARPELIEIRKDYGYTPLLAAAAAGNEDIVELLLTKGSAENETDYFANTALHLAAGKGHADVVRVMLANGASPALKNSQGDLPLHLAADADHCEVARLLIEARADINAKDSLGRTALKRATDRGHNKIAELLRTLGALQQ